MLSAMSTAGSPAGEAGTVHTAGGVNIEGYGRKIGPVHMAGGLGDIAGKAGWTPSRPRRDFVPPYYE